MRKLKFKESDGAKTLDKVENLNLSQFDCQHLVDPLFKKTTRMFDEISLSTLMSGQLQSTPNLLLKLDSNLVKVTNNKLDVCEEHNQYAGKLSEMMQSANE